MNILFWLTVKHFFCDFPLQANPYMYANKGKYGHPGGLLHAGIHVGGTYIVLAALAMPWALYLALADGLIHYHIDLAKVRIGAAYNLKPDNSEYYWMLLGFDQLLHYMTYFGIAFILGEF